MDLLCLAIGVQIEGEGPFGQFSGRAFEVDHQRILQFGADLKLARVLGDELATHGQLERDVELFAIGGVHDTRSGEGCRLTLLMAPLIGIHQRLPWAVLVIITRVVVIACARGWVRRRRRRP